MTSLGEVVDIRGGGTPSKAIPEYWGGSIPWASVKDFKSTILESTEDYITELGVQHSATNVIPAGSIVVPTRMAVGKVALLAVDMAINQDLKALIVKDEKALDKRYLLRFLESQSNNILKHAKGATVKGITLDVLRELEIPLPPLTEQKRIAAILDKADAVRRKRQQAIELSDEFLRSVFLDMFGDPVTNPKGWEVKPLSTLVSKLGDGLHGTPSYDSAGEYYFINGNNLNNGVIELSDKVKKVSQREYEKHKKELNENTMLVSINGTIGKVAFYGGEKVVLGKSACYFNLKPGVISSTYLFYLIQSHYFLHYVSSIVTGSTIKNVSLKSMREFPVPIPPLEIQDKFERIIVILAAKKRLYLQAIEGVDNCFNALSQNAFSGHP